MLYTEVHSLSFHDLIPEYISVNMLNLAASSYGNYNSQSPAGGRLELQMYTHSVGSLLGTPT